MGAPAGKGLAEGGFAWGGTELPKESCSRGRSLVRRGIGLGAGEGSSGGKGELTPRAEQGEGAVAGRSCCRVGGAHGCRDGVCKGANPLLVSRTLGLQRGDPLGRDGVPGCWWPACLPPAALRLCGRQRRWKCTRGDWTGSWDFSSSRSLGPRVVQRRAVAVSQQQGL